MPLNSNYFYQIGRFGIIFHTRPCEIDDLAVLFLHAGPALHVSSACHVNCTGSLENKTPFFAFLNKEKSNKKSGKNPKYLEINNF